MSEAVRVKGLRETQRALNKVNKEAAKTVRDALKDTARPVAETAKGLLSRYPGSSPRTIRPRASVKGVFVTQGARKVSGLRPDFGALQMNQVLIPALEQHEDELVDSVEDALDMLGRQAGF